MEYRKDKRTKKLTLRDIHVGDWVQVWRPDSKEYTPPMKVSSINYDGTVYLVSDDKGYSNPYEANVENVDALPIDEELLKGFGFERASKDDEFIYGDYNFTYNTRYSRLSHLYWDSAYYFHEMQDKLSKRYNINFEWKGVEK